MINKENGLVEIYERIKAKRTDLGLRAFRRNPTKPADPSLLPCLFMIEGEDHITKRSGRSATGYPAKRNAEITIELVVGKDADIKAMYRNLRRFVFMERGSDPVVYNPRVAENVFISELRSNGPSGVGIPDISSMEMILEMTYIDEGF